MKPKNATALPSLSDVNDAEVAHSALSHKAPEAPPSRLIEELREAAASVATIQMPLAEYPPHAYAARHIEVRLSEDQAHTLKRIFCALEKQGATLESGQPIRRAPDVFRYLLEKIADA